MFGRAFACTVYFRLAFYGVVFNGFFAFLDSRVETALSHVGCAFVAHGEDGKHFGEIVFVALLLGKHSLFVSLVSVEICVVSCGERVVEARYGCVFACGACGKHSHKNE